MKTCPKGQEFYFSNGAMANTIAQLKAQIKKLNAQQYSHHVNADKNDFYNWVYHCINKRTAAKIKGNLPKKELLAKL